jgi:hypothetical protein
VARYLCPAGWLWFCQKCGRTSRDKYGEFAIHPNWHKGCVKGSQGCYLESLCVEEVYLEYHDEPNPREKPRVKSVKPGAVLREYPP